MARTELTITEKSIIPVFSANRFERLAASPNVDCRLNEATDNDTPLNVRIHLKRAHLLFVGA